ncbi:MAG: ABC transporter permease [Acidimicrobiia bacterium]|nr:ABC transporter permease [Acidimicrobiia bacterium]
MTSLTAEVRTGPTEWLRGYRVMTRWELSSLRLLLPLIVAVQVLVGGGFALGIGLFFEEIPTRNALFLTTGVAVVTLITVGFVLGPQLVSNQKTAGTYDFMWSLPVPRTSQAAAWTTVNAFIALPGMIAALLIAGWRYDLPLRVSWSVVPAVVLTIVTATMVGYAFAHAIPKPMITQLITQLLIFVILGFAPINFPQENLPAWLAEVNMYLPFHHMAVVIRAGLTDGLVSGVVGSYAVVGAYAVASTVVAAIVIGRRG